ncbi:helix-turn-helix domain-containing protein [Enterobacter hormaechei]|uniref:helix-turn-helix domain-containing protein n=1 Tax=Enterobacter hormaechei TaxID=158836 RepID=UPI000AAECD74|nr:helix-turn-helix domain-containing protein [Enterobacter hormaechei]
MLLSKSAYARHMGVSRQTVYGWIARGEIVISGDKVDVEASQAKQNSAGAGEHQTEMSGRRPPHGYGGMTVGKSCRLIMMLASE